MFLHVLPSFSATVESVSPVGAEEAWQGETVEMEVALKRPEGPFFFLALIHLPRH